MRLGVGDSRATACRGLDRLHRGERGGLRATGAISCTQIGNPALFCSTFVPRHASSVARIRAQEGPSARPRGRRSSASTLVVGERRRRVVAQKGHDAVGCPAGERLVHLVLDGAHQLIVRRQQEQNVFGSYRLETGQPIS
jgi:hypothetical protein